MPSPIPGLLYVPLHQGSLTDAELNHWYSNQHTPVRMRYPFFVNGQRYKRIPDVQDVPAGDNPSDHVPNWLAIYDVSDMHQLEQQPYTNLLTPRIQSRQDQDYIARVTASRKYFDHVATYSAPNYLEQELLLRTTKGRPDPGILIVVHVKLSSDQPEAEAEWDRWYEEDHLPPLRKVPGWMRTRRFRSSVLESRSGQATEYITLNEFADPAAVGGPEHLIAIKTESKTNVVAAKRRECWRLDYVLGKGPKDLSALALLGDTKTGGYISPDGMTRTSFDQWPVIESYIFTESTGVVEYRLEGRGDQFSDILVVGTVCGLDWKIWDPLVSAVLKRRMDIRILRVKLSARPLLADLPVVSGAAFVELKTAIDTVSTQLVLPPAPCALGMALAGETVEQRFDPYSVRTWTELEHHTLTTAQGVPPAGLAITARTRADLEIAVMRFMARFEESETVTEWTRNIF